jgi:hypothetical protein
MRWSRQAEPAAGLLTITFSWAWDIDAGTPATINLAAMCLAEAFDTPASTMCPAAPPW